MDISFAENSNINYTNLTMKYCYQSTCDIDKKLKIPKKPVTYLISLNEMYFLLLTNIVVTYHNKILITFSKQHLCVLT